jgi:dienelactone hydrolase
MLLLLTPFACADEPKPILDKSSAPELIRTLHEGSNFKPYTDKGAWQKRATYLREQVLISAGLWPMPEKCPLNAVIHGRIDRDDYTIEKVYFQSYPGFYVTGNLYRPKGKAGRLPAVLSPHGHWVNGRLYEAPDKEVKKQLDSGWEKDADAARYPMQARCANLAKLGCIVFLYDMVGYADADAEHFPHRATYRDLDSDLHGLSVFGLQTWDSIRSLDFLESLPDVDRKRIAITGASGGASQSIMMMTIDDRLACAAPVNMISAGEHQGGCVCENNSLLRIGTDNVELAATFAPRPFIHPTATGDWTKDFLEHGFPEIQATYKLFGAEADVESMRQTAPHNYNLHAREAVYNFFNKHLKLGHEGVITEAKFTPVKPKELSVWDEGHPRPQDAVDAAGLKKWWVEMTGRQIEAMKPKDRAGIQAVERTLRPALVHILGGVGASDEQPDVDLIGPPQVGKIEISRFILTRVSEHRGVSFMFFSEPGTGLLGRAGLGPVVLALPHGISDALNADGTPTKFVAALVQAGRHVVVPEVPGSRELAPPDASKPAAIEFVAGYNATWIARRAHDLLVYIDRKNADPMDLVGVGEAGKWCLLARAAATGDRIERTIVDASACELTGAQSESDANFLPHSLRYGGIWPLASLGRASPLYLHHVPSGVAPAWLKTTYDAAGASDKLHVEKGAKPEDIVRWLQR